MLVHNGADLNARTKHDETPAGMKLNSLLLNKTSLEFHQDLFMYTGLQVFILNER